MKQLFVLLLLSIVFSTKELYGQTPNTEAGTIAADSIKMPEKVYDFIEWMPEFPNGKEGLFAYLAENLIYPKKAIKKKVEGTVYVKFIIDENGRCINPFIAKGLSRECDAEVLRVINTMPAWTPGKQGGKPAAVWYVLPVKFVLPK